MLKCNLLDPVYLALDLSLSPDLIDEAYSELSRFIEEMRAVEENTGFERLFKLTMTDTYYAELWSHSPFNKYGVLWQIWFYKKFTPIINIIDSQIECTCDSDYAYENRLVPIEVLILFNKMLCDLELHGCNEINLLIPDSDTSSLTPTSSPDQFRTTNERKIDEWTHLLNPSEIYCTDSNSLNASTNRERWEKKTELIQKNIKLCFILNYSHGIWIKNFRGEGVIKDEITNLFKKNQLIIENRFFRDLSRIERPTFGLGCDLSQLYKNMLDSISAQLYVPELQMYRPHRRRGNSSMFQCDIFQHSEGAGRSMRIYYRIVHEGNIRFIILEELIRDEHSS